MPCHARARVLRQDHAAPLKAGVVDMQSLEFGVGDVWSIGSDGGGGMVFVSTMAHDQRGGSCRGFL